MALVKVRRNHQVTLPRNLRDKLRITEGDYLEIEEHGGRIVLHPVRVVALDQAYFHTKEWQTGEAQADNDIAEGRVLGPFDNAQDALEALKKAKE